jgi:hypothetical protein
MEAAFVPLFMLTPLNDVNEPEWQPLQSRVLMGTCFATPATVIGW